MKKRLSLAVVVMGFSGLVAQVLLLREFMVSFAGNELIIGIILANWLLLEALGAGLGGYIFPKKGKRPELFVSINIVFALSLPLVTAAIRLLPAYAPGGPGEGVGLQTVLIFSFLVLLPVSLSHGALFSGGCRIWTHYVGQPAETAGRVYVLESAGTILGGLAFTYLLVLYLPSYAIVLLVAGLNLVISFFLLPFKRSEAGVWSWSLAGLLTILIIVLGAGTITSYFYQIDRYTLGRRWPGQELLFSENSIYGNIAVARRGAQRTFYQDGQPVTTLPDPDRVAFEGFVHIPLLFHRQPRDVLVLSGGAGGVIDEMLKHNPDRLDYVELDPQLLETLKRFPDPLSERELTDPRVNLHHRDGRRFIDRSERQYDVVLVGFQEPFNLQVNRLFTREFYESLARRLNSEGILAFRLPGSMAYLSDEMRKLNASVRSALEEVFASVVSLPGDAGILHLASPDETAFAADSMELGQRMQEREVDAMLVSKGYLRHRFDDRRRDWFRERVEQTEARANLDFRPGAVYFSLAHWSSLFSPWLRPLFSFLERLSLTKLLFVLGVGGIVLGGVVLSFATSIRPTLFLAILTTGFAGMLFDLLVIFSFQSLYGYVFYWVGLLITAFMAGSLLGALVANRYLRDDKPALELFFGIELSLVILALLLPLVLIFFRQLAVSPWPYHYIFPLLSCLSGLLIGAQFPLANNLFISSDEESVGRTAGLLYGADLLGGWIGGIAGGAALLPLLGLVETSLFVGGLKLVSILLLGFALFLYGR